MGLSDKEVEKSRLEYGTNEITKIKKEVNDIMWVDKNTILKLYFDNKFETTSFFWKAINFED